MRARIESMVTILLNNETRVEALKQSGKELDKKFNAGDISVKDYEAKKKEISAEIASTKAASLAEFNELKNQGAAELKEWATLKVEDMPKEIEFLNNPLYLLTADEVQRLSDTYRDNYTFQRALNGYAASKGIDYRKAPSYEKRKVDRLQLSVQFR